MLTMMSPYALAQVLSAWKAILVTSPGLSIHLFQNNIVPTPANVIADFTEATFDGYAPLALTALAGPFRQPDGSFRILNDWAFQMTGSTTPNLIYGYWAEDHTGALIFAERWPAPVSMVDAFSEIHLTVGVGVNAGSIIGTNLPN
jgi:hypothetical protein